MRKNLTTITMLTLVSFVALVSCSKKQVEKIEQTGTAVQQAASSFSQELNELSGSPAEKLIQVMRKGVNALKNNSDVAAASKELMAILGKYNVASLIEEAKVAKEKGEGASQEQKDTLNKLKDEYKGLANKFAAGSNSAFLAAHEAFSKAFNIN